MRLPYQVLVFPYYIGDKGIEYSVFHRSDADWWQAISGGGEEGETIIESEYKWLSYSDAISCLKWDGKKVALWELNKRISRIIL